MARPLGSKTYPLTVSFEAGRVRVARRGNGLFALRWRENGAWLATTKSGEANALKWAAEKARELNRGVGSQWVRAGEAEALETLRWLAGPGHGDVRRWLEDARDAVKWLDGHADLTTAARYYAEFGPMRVERVTLQVAVERFVAQYGDQAQTQKTFGNELAAFLETRPLALLLDVTHEDLERWVHRKVEGDDAKRKVKAAPRTVRNRITTWITFLNRCRDWKLLPENSKHAAETLKRPKIPDAGKEIFSVDQGRMLIEAAVKDERRCLPFLVCAGWLGLRPSECQRLTWELVDWKRSYLHVSTRVAGKTSTERWVPIPEAALAVLRVLYEGREKKRRTVCLFRSREFLSVLARKNGVCEEWPDDVLRHSAISYRLAEIHDMARVAEESGNSPGIIRKHYRRPVLPEEGIAWRELMGHLLALLQTA